MSESQLENLKLWLGEKFDNNDEGHIRIEKHLIKLNSGQEKNTIFRLKIQGGWGMLKILFGTSIVANIVSIAVFWSNK